MSTEAWIFMVGFRVFDVGLLIVWLVWFFRLRDGRGGEEGPEDDEGGGGGGGPTRDQPPLPGGGGFGLPTGRLGSGGARLRGGHGRSRKPVPTRRPAPARGPLPARVRSPGTPARVIRRA